MSDSKCGQCGKGMGQPYWSNLFKSFCSLECTNEYLEGEGFDPITGPGQSAGLSQESRDLMEDLDRENAKKKAMAKKKTKKKKKATAKKRGRPKGAKAKKYQTVDVIPPGCPKCGSDQRTAYTSSRTLETPGVIQGKEYSRVILRRCACLKCGQNLIERTYEK